MKYILKQSEPECLAQFKAEACENWTPGYENLDTATKNGIKVALMKEQGYICCYCERRLTSDDSHIEHLLPQASSPVLALDYSNLLCSCQNAQRRGEPRHCGHLKDERNLPISPLDPSCESRFAFTGDGRISTANAADTEAAETIKVLGLAIENLTALRAGCIEPFLEVDLSEYELQMFVTGYLKPSSSGEFGEFWTTINYLFRAYVIA